MLVRDVMSGNVKTVRPNSTILEVVRKMNKFDVGSVVVVEGDRPVGIITERDILRRVLEVTLAPEALKAKEIMSSPLVTIGDHATLEEAARMMAERNIKKLPVVQDGRLIGIVTTTDIVKNQPKYVDVLRDLVWRTGKT
ncbi:CBS domain-containing protein [Candidatus Bathyarchaeota archaeon]|nr:CBS domain-containing protein [Candidatus Bathyarchaeota archaeon]MBS7628673.1 CBS domain-containing protein [Candidatus Bathyarchaeota archaeon]